MGNEINEESMSSIGLQVASLMLEVAKEAKENGWSDIDSAFDLRDTVIEYLNENFKQEQFTDEQWKKLEQTAVSQYVISIIGYNRE